MIGDDLICLTRDEAFWYLIKFTVCTTVITELFVAPVLMATLRYFFQKAKE